MVSDGTGCVVLAEAKADFTHFATSESVGRRFVRMRSAQAGKPPEGG